MRRFGVLVLTVLLTINTLWFIGAIILLINEELGAAQIATLGLVFLFFSGLFSEWRRKLRRKIPPRHWTSPTPRREKKPKPAPEISTPVAQPQAAAPRRFAPIPLVQAIEQHTVPAASSIPDQMRCFIERGEQAIHVVAKPPDVEAEPAAVRQSADPFAPALSQPPEPKDETARATPQPPPMPQQQT